MTSKQKTFLGYQLKETSVKQHYEIGTIQTTDGTEDVVNRTPTPRLVIYSDGYGTPVFANLGDYVVIVGVNNPPNITERGVATFEPLQLRYCGPSETTARLVARQEFDRVKDSICELRSANQPLPYVYVYRLMENTYRPKPTSPTCHFSDIPVTSLWMERPEHTPEVDSMIAYLQSIPKPEEETPRE